jgi:hypothetical protein
MVTWLDERWYAEGDASRFPTRYRANTNKTLGVLAATAGLEVASITLFEGRPEYARIHPVLYVFGTLYERLVNGAEWARFSGSSLTASSQSHFDDNCRRGGGSQRGEAAKIGVSHRMDSLL